MEDTLRWCSDVAGERMDQANAFRLYGIHSDDPCITLVTNTGMPMHPPIVQAELGQIAC